MNQSTAVERKRRFSIFFLRFFFIDICPLNMEFRLFIVVPGNVLMMSFIWSLSNLFCLHNLDYSRRAQYSRFVFKWFRYREKVCCPSSSLSLSPFLLLFLFFLLIGAHWIIRVAQSQYAQRDDNGAHLSAPISSLSWVCACSLLSSLHFLSNLISRRHLLRVWDWRQDFRCERKMNHMHGKDG